MCDAQGYSDDLTILVRGKFKSTLGDRVRAALKTVENWCHEKGLKVNPAKTDLVLFSRRRTGSDLVERIRLFNVEVELSPQVKYLGDTLDSKLNWIAHVKDKRRKLWRLFGSARTPSGEIEVYRPKLFCDCMRL